jgi:type IV secretory pathway VirB4 component
MDLPFLQKPKKDEGPKEFTALSPQEIYEQGVATLKDLIAPAGLEVAQNHLKLAGKLSRTIFIFSYPNTISVGWFSPLINLDETFDTGIFFHPVDTGQTLHKLRKRAAQLEAQMADEQEKGLVRNPLLEAALKNIEDLRDSLQQGSDRLFQVSCAITFFADDKEGLAKIESKFMSLLGNYQVSAKQAIFQQFEGYETSMPLGRDILGIRTALNLGPASTFFPFISVDLTQDQGILYGINTHNNSLVIFDRFSTENANMVVFAKSGSGKSYFAKLDAIRSLMIGIDILIIDPENEYEKLARSLGGNFFRISVGSPDRINPFDIPPVGENESPEEVLRSHVLQLIGLIKVMIGDIKPEEEVILDQAIQQAYASRDILPEQPFVGKEAPLMSDLEAVLSGMEGGKELAAKLYKFTKGTFAEFINHPTSVSTDNRLLVFSIRDLEEELRPVAMYLVLHHIWTSIRKKMKKRLVVIDEAWWMMRHPDSANFLMQLAKRARKYFLGLTTITQDIEDFLASPQGKPMITNSSLQLLLRQSPASIDKLAEVFKLTDLEKETLRSAGVGEGIFFAGLKHAMIKVVPSYTEDLIITSDPSQLLSMKREQLKKDEEV